MIGEGSEHRVTELAAFVLALAVISCGNDPPSTIDDGGPKDLIQLVECRSTPVIAVEQMPPLVPAAFLAAEDGRFYEGHGPGSPIIQMIVKIMPGIEKGCLGSEAGPAVPPTEDKHQRKRRETQLAARLDRELTRPQILSIYLNHVYLGHGTYGVVEAARTYFGKQLAQLTIAEAALLAGLAASPPKFAPDREPQRALQRRAYVLHRMREGGFISPAELEAALAEPIKLVDAP
jgi:penicillin-binding protein 1A